MERAMRNGRMLRPMGLRLQLLALRAGLCQARIAEALGVSNATAHRWFRDGQPPDLEHALGLARLLGVPVEALCGAAADGAPQGLDPFQREVLWVARLVGLDLAPSPAAADPLRAIGGAA